MLDFVDIILYFTMLLNIYVYISVKVKNESPSPSPNLKRFSLQLFELMKRQPFYISQIELS